MQYWKLGCRWGSKIEGKPLFYHLLLKYNIVIGWENKDYGINVRISAKVPPLFRAKLTPELAAERGSECPTKSYQR